jgi:hypothetical protein
MKVEKADSLLSYIEDGIIISSLTARKEIHAFVDELNMEESWNIFEELKNKKIYYRESIWNVKAEKTEKGG